MRSYRLGLNSVSTHSKSFSADRAEDQELKKGQRQQLHPKALNFNILAAASIRKGPQLTFKLNKIRYEEGAVKSAAFPVRLTESQFGTIWEADILRTKRMLYELEGFKVWQKPLYFKEL